MAIREYSSLGTVLSVALLILGGNEMALGFPAFDQALAIIRHADWDGLGEIQTMLDSQKKIKALLDTVGDRERDMLEWRDRMFEESKKD